MKIFINAAVCAKTIVKESRNFELAHLKKKKKVVWRLSGWCFHDGFRATMSIFGRENS